MADFYQNGIITTLHNLSNRTVEDIETELISFRSERPMAVILPSLFSELEDWNFGKYGREAHQAAQKNQKNVEKLFGAASDEKLAKNDVVRSKFTLMSNMLVVPDSDQYFTTNDGAAIVAVKQFRRKASEEISSTGHGGRVAGARDAPQSAVSWTHDVVSQRVTTFDPNFEHRLFGCRLLCAPPKVHSPPPHPVCRCRHISLPPRHSRICPASPPSAATHTGGVWRPSR